VLGVSLQGDITVSQAAVHPIFPYSPERVEGEFSVVRVQDHA
jgi:hypothetical protein